MMQQTEKRTLAFGSYLSCVILVHADAPPSDREWNLYLEFMKAQMSPDTKVLVMGRGPGPSAAQRARLVTIVGKAGVPTAVLTESAIARGIVTALNWIWGQKLAAFPTARLEEALAYIGVPVGFALKVRGVIDKLSAEIASNRPI